MTREMKLFTGLVLLVVVALVLCFNWEAKHNQPARVAKANEARTVFDQQFDQDAKVLLDAIQRYHSRTGQLPPSWHEIRQYFDADARARFKVRRDMLLGDDVELFDPRFDWIDDICPVDSRIGLYTYVYRPIINQESGRVAAFQLYLYYASPLQRMYMGYVTILGTLDTFRCRN
jgi:hypothetical protein